LIALQFGVAPVFMTPRRRTAAIVVVAAALVTCLELTPVNRFDIAMKLRVRALQFTLVGTSDIGQGELDALSVQGARALTLPAELADGDTTLEPPPGAATFAFSVERGDGGALALAPLQLDPGSEVMAVGLARQPPAFELAVLGHVLEPLHVLLKHSVTLHAPQLKNNAPRDVGHALPHLTAALAERFKVRGAYSTSSVDLLDEACEISGLAFTLPHDPALQARPQSSVVDGKIELVASHRHIDVTEGWLIKPHDLEGELRLTAESDGSLRVDFRGSTRTLQVGNSPASLRDQTPSSLDSIARNPTLRSIVKGTAVLVSHLLKLFSQ
jgi:hypothetical protein